MEDEITAKHRIWRIVILIILLLIVIWLFFLGGLYTLTGINF
jgi:type II secretory pathway component PulL